MKPTLIILASIGLALAALPAAASDNSWLTDFEKAKQEAAKTQRPILADFSGSDWCGWCIKLDKEVFSKAEFKAYAKDHLVLFVADFPRKQEQPDEIRKQNEGLSSTYRIPGFPTVLLLDASGKELARTGYKAGGAAAYVEHLKTLLQPKSEPTPQPKEAPKP